MKRSIFITLLVVISGILVTGCKSNENPINLADDERNIIGNTNGNIINEAITAQQGEWIYYSNGLPNSPIGKKGRLYKVKIDGTNKKRLSYNCPVTINVVGEWIYYTTSVSLADEVTLYKMKIDGSKKIELCKNDSPLNIIVVGDWIYYINCNDNNCIYKIKTDGTNRKKLNHDNLYEIPEFNIERNMIYYTKPTDKRKIYKMTIDGKNIAKVNNDKSWGLNVQGDWIYYINDEDSKIYKIKTDGTGRTQLNDDYVTEINVNNNWIYYSNEDDRGTLYKMKIDGTGRKKLNKDKVSCVNIQEDWIYYINNSDDDSIYRIKIDGTSRSKFGD